MKPAGIHFLNYQSFILTHPFSFLDKATGPILPFVALPLSLHWFKQVYMIIYGKVDKYCGQKRSWFAQIVANRGLLYSWKQKTLQIIHIYYTSTDFYYIRVDINYWLPKNHHKKTPCNNSAAFSKASAHDRSPTKQYLWRHFLLFNRQTFASARFAESSTDYLPAKTCDSLKD